MVAVTNIFTFTVADAMEKSRLQGYSQAITDKDLISRKDVEDLINLIFTDIWREIETSSFAWFVNQELPKIEKKIKQKLKVLKSARVKGKQSPQGVKQK